LHYARFPLFPPVSFLLNLDSTRLPGHRYLPMIVCMKSLTRLGLHYACFPLSPPVSFLLNLDSTRLLGHRYLPMIVCVKILSRLLSDSLSSIELPPVSLIQVRVVFQHPVINKLFAITMEGGPRK
jgi:hypothetical protein